MAAPSNTSHSSNLANFNSLIKNVQEFGTRYNPPKPILSLANMESQYLRGINVVNSLQSSEATCREVMVLRSNLFDSLDSYAQRVVGIFTITSGDSKAAENVKMILRNMRPKPTGKKPAANAATEAEAAQTRSTSQLGFEDRSSNFAQIASFVESSASYVANEADLTKEAIRKYSNDLKAANNNMLQAETTLESARIERDKILYSNEDSLYNIFREVKTYIKAAFGTSSIEYKRVSGLEFRNYNK